MKIGPRLMKIGKLAWICVPKIGPRLMTITQNLAKIVLVLVTHASMLLLLKSDRMLLLISGN